MLTLAIIDSIIQQYDKTAGFMATDPEPIKTIRAILKKPDYINYKNLPQQKLLQPDDLWQLVSAWDQNQNLFAAFTYQGNNAVQNVVRILRAFKNNDMLSKENMSIFYDEAKYEYLNNCISFPLYIQDNPEGNQLLDFIVKQVNDYKTWNAPLKFLKKNEQLTLENLNKISAHIAVINKAIVQHELVDLREYSLPKLVNLIIKYPASAAQLIQFYVDDEKKDHNLNGKLDYIDQYNITEQEALTQLKTYAATNMLFPDHYSDRISDQEVIGFICTHMKDLPVWKAIIEFLKSAKILNITNLNKVGNNVRLISAAIDDGGLHIGYNNYQTVFDLLVNNPQHAKIIYKHIRTMQYSTEAVESAPLIAMCKDIGEDALSCLDSENRTFLNGLSVEIREFVLLHINDYAHWEVIVKRLHLQSRSILTVENLKRAENNPAKIAQAVSRCTLTQDAYNLLTENPEHSHAISQHLSNIYGQDEAVKLINQYKIFSPESLSYLSYANVSILKSSSKEIVDFIMARIDNHAQWNNIVQYLSAAKILTLDNLNKAEPVLADISAAISHIPPKEKLTQGNQKFYDLMIANPKKSKNLFKNYYNLDAFHDSVTVDLIEKYKLFEDDDFKYFTDDNIILIRAVFDQGVRHSIMEHIKDYEKWNSVIRYLFKTDILNITNLRTAQDHIDLLYNVTSKNKTRNASPEEHQNVFNFMIENPQYAENVFKNPDSCVAIEFLSDIRPNSRVQILQNAQFTCAARNLIILLNDTQSQQEGDIDFIISNLETASYLHTCLNILTKSGLQEYFPNVIELKEDPEQLKILAEALKNAASDDSVIFGGKDIFEIIMQYPHQFSEILKKLKPSGLATEENINLIILNIEYIDEIQEAITLLPTSLLNQQSLEEICTAGEYAQHLARGLIELGEKSDVGDRALILQIPRYANTIALALKIIGKLKDKYKNMILKNPAHCDKLMTGILHLENYKEAQQWPRLQAQYADTLAQAYVILMKMGSKDAAELINANPEYALDMAKAMMKANNGKLPTPEFITFIKHQAQHARTIETTVDNINERSKKTGYNYMPLLIMSFDIESKTLSTHPSYEIFINQKNGIKLSPQTFMTELVQLNCSFSNLLLGKIFASYEFENTYHPNKAQVFLKKIQAGDPCYFIAQRLLFDILLNECHRLSTDNTDPELLAKYTQDLNQVVRILMENSQEGDALKQMDEYSRTGKFLVNDRFVKLPEIALNKISANRKTSTMSAQTESWENLIKQHMQTVTNNNNNNNNNDHTSREQYTFD